MPELAYVNGIFSPIETAMVPVEDRGYQFGDAVYEFIASYNGRLFFLDAHLDRLERSLTALAFPTLDKKKIREAVLALFQRAGLPRAGVYIQISRGVAPRNHVVSDLPNVQMIMTVRKVKEIDAKLRKEGVSVITMKDFRWGRCDIKTVQLLANVMAKQQALAAGVYDTIFLAEDDVVREATSSNVFMVTAGKLITHPLNTHILAGITRAVIIDCAGEIPLPVEERFYTIKELYHANEVFLTATATEVLSVVKIDGEKIGEGTVGPITKRLFEALQEQYNKPE
ncbi:D-amino acid aminotransferase [Thermodesulfobacteriota bacterium]